MGRQRGVADHRRRSDVRSVPQLVCDVVLGTVFATVGNPVRHDPARRRHRVAGQDRRPPVARMGRRGHRGRILAACHPVGRRVRDPPPGPADRRRRSRAPVGRGRAERLHASRRPGDRVAVRVLRGGVRGPQDRRTDARRRIPLRTRSVVAGDHFRRRVRAVDTVGARQVVDVACSRGRRDRPADGRGADVDPPPRRLGVPVDDARRRRRGGAAVRFDVSESVALHAQPGLERDDLQRLVHPVHAERSCRGPR